MAKIQFLTILLTVTCFLGGVVSVTDKVFEELVAVVNQQQKLFEQQALKLEEQSHTITEQSKTNEDQSAIIEALTEKMKRQDDRIEKLDCNIRCDHPRHPLDERLFQNMTIEERVSLLEIQVGELEEDVMDFDVDLIELEGDVDFLFDETVIQDERLFALEQITVAITADLVAVDDELDLIDDEFDTINNELESVQTSIIALDFRVTTLEENGGGGGNSSVTELEVRVETLEGTAANHETRISAAETNINDLEETTFDHETRLTAAEENIQGLQMTDVELEERITELEENSEGGNTQNATVAFHTVLTSYVTIPDQSAILFNAVLLNEGNGYNSSTGTFTVPPGGDGYYYLSVYLRAVGGEFSNFAVQLNDERICTVYSDLTASPTTDDEITTCSGVTFAAEGDTVRVVYINGADTTPLVDGTAYYFNGFTGFRL